MYVMQNAIDALHEWAELWQLSVYSQGIFFGLGFCWQAKIWLFASGNVPHKSRVYTGAASL